MLNAFREWCDRNPKPALGIGGGLLLVVVILFARSFSGGSDLPIAATIRMVCVKTGKVYTLNTEDIRTFPSKNPQTGERTLLPVEERDGHEVVPRRYARLVTEELKDANKFVDPKSLVVKENS